MNALSWLIYLADVAEEINGIGGAAVVVSFLVGIALLICFIVGGVMTMDAYDDEDRAKAKGPRVFGVKAAKIILPWCAAMVLLATVVPSKETIYAIAASQLGEQVIKSETAGKAIDALNAWLDRQIAKPTA